MTDQPTVSPEGALLRQFERIADVGGWSLDPKTREVEWTERVYAIHGADPHAFRPTLQATLDLCAPSSRDALAAAIDRALDAGAPWDLELELIDAAGRTRRVRSTGEPLLSEGRCIRLVGALRDVSDPHDALRRAEAEQQRLSEKLRLATDALNIGTFEFDQASGRGTWNAAMKRLHGLTPDDPVPSRDEWRETFVHPDDRAAQLHQAQRLDSVGQPYDFEYRIRRRDGAWRWLHSRALRAPGAADGDGSVIGVTIDITDRKRDEAKLRLLTAGTDIGIYERDLESGEVFWDAQMFRLFGLPPAAAAPSPETVVELIHPEDRERFRQRRERLTRSDGPGGELECRVLRPDGTVRWLLIRSTREFAADDRVARVAGIVIDVTASHEATQRLREATERLRVAAEVGGIASWERNLLTGVARWDDALFDLYGLRAADGAPSREVAVAMVHPDDRATVVAAWERIRQANHSVEYEYRLVRPDGKILYLNSRGIAERDADGRPWRIIGATIDVTRRWEAERQLGEYGDWLRLAGESMEIGLFQAGVDDSFHRSDRQIKRMYGFDPDGPEPTRQQFSDAVIPEDRDVNRAARERALQTDEPVEAEYRVRLPSGSIRHIFTRRIRRCDAAGRPLYVIGTAIDVTRSRHAQEALQAFSERLRLATRTARIGIWQRDIATNTITWDTRMREIYGVAADWQLTPQSWLACTHPEDRARLAPRFGPSVEDDDHGSSEFRIVLPGGGVRHVIENFVVRRDEVGVAVQVLGTNLDITDIRRAQQERDLLYERMQLAAESIGLGVWDWDLRTGTSVWNDQMHALFGHTREEAADRLWSDFAHPDDVEPVRAAIRAAIASNDSFDLEFRVPVDGRVRWIASRGRVQRDPAGMPMRLVGVSWDITDKRAAEEALRDKEAAERASQAKSEFLSRMSHELRTPLNAILGFAQLMDLDRANALSPVQFDRVKQIEKAGWHLLTLINEVLELSRIESGALTVEVTSVPLAGVVNESVELITPTAAPRGIAIDVHLDGEAATTVRADATRLKQVMLNLLSNAVKFNRDGGRVGVAIGRADGTAVIRVRDTGRGMSDAQLQQLFQPFNRLGIRDDVVEGTGIGLSITRRLLDLMGGRIDVTSEVGRGSEFRVHLPLAPPIRASDE